MKYCSCSFYNISYCCFLRICCIGDRCIFTNIRRYWRNIALSTVIGINWHQRSPHMVFRCIARKKINNRVTRHRWISNLSRVTRIIGINYWRFWAIRIRDNPVAELVVNILNIRGLWNIWIFNCDCRITYWILYHRIWGLYICICFANFSILSNWSRHCSIWTSLSVSNNYSIMKVFNITSTNLSVWWHNAIWIRRCSSIVTIYKYGTRRIFLAD